MKVINKTVISDTAPNDVNVLWFNPKDNKLRVFTNNEWAAEEGEGGKEKDDKTTPDYVDDDGNEWDEVGTYDYRYFTRISTADVIIYNNTKHISVCSYVTYPDGNYTNGTIKLSPSVFYDKLAKAEKVAVKLNSDNLALYNNINLYITKNLPSYFLFKLDEGSSYHYNKGVVTNTLLVLQRNLNYSEFFYDGDVNQRSIHFVIGSTMGTDKTLVSINSVTLYVPHEKK